MRARMARIGPICTDFFPAMTNLVVEKGARAPLPKPYESTFFDLGSGHAFRQLKIVDP